MVLKLAHPRSKKFARKRQQLRDEMWPDAAAIVWSRETEKGFTSIPRTLPLIMRLIGELAPKQSGNPSRVYLDLWSRVFDEGFVQIDDPDDCAYAAGYTGKRAARSWRENIRVLEQLGFIRTAEAGNREIAYVLIVNPHLVACRLRTVAHGGQVTQEWWNAFAARCQAIGAEMPSADAGAAVG